MSAPATPDEEPRQDPADPAALPSGDAVVAELRRTRRAIRLGDTEWFDVLYRVYLFALAGTIAVILASDAVEGLVGDEVSTETLLDRGPTIAGIVAVLAVGIGLRNGADGGPISVEPADVRHLLTAPIDRRRALLRPIVQRFRSLAFGAALTLGILGQLVGREIDGSRAAWAGSGALFGVVLAALYVSAAIIAHALRLPPALASAIFVVLLAWQGAAAWATWPDTPVDAVGIGPGDLHGSLLFWGIRQPTIDIVAIAATVIGLVVATGLGGRLRLDPLERRGQLVSQLRFAATVQDIRTVVLLRRQLRAESVRARSLLGGAHFPGRQAARVSSRRPDRAERHPAPTIVWRRGATAIGRLPIGRLLRIATLAAVAGVTGALAVSSSPLLLVAFVAASFVLGLEALEPLAQEIDRPSITDSIPIDRGWLFAHHLVAPAGLLAGAGLIGAAFAAVVEPGNAVGAFALAIPLAWVGSIGAVVTTVGDAPDPPTVAGLTLTGAERSAESPFALPEFAGVSQLGKGAIPVVFSAVGALCLLALRNEPSAAIVLRSILGVALCLAVMVWWVVRRDRINSRIREFFAAGRQAQAAAS
ncbi:MAG: hypothetical protein AB8G26_05490 [Ilumatobacter sp.]